MDIDGVEADYLSQDEVFELYDKIVDSNDEEFLGLENINTNDLEENRLQELYDDILYRNDKMFVSNNADNLSDTKFMDINRNVVDFDNSEIVTLNGINFDINSLSDEEISSLYDDFLLIPDYIATVIGYTYEQNATKCVGGDITNTLQQFASYREYLACFPVTCATSDTSVSTNGYVSFQICNYTYSYVKQIHDDMNSGGSGGNESCYYMYLVASTNSTYGYKVIGFYVQCYYKYYTKYGAAYDYTRLSSSYDTGAK